MCSTPSTLASITGAAPIRYCEGYAALLRTLCLAKLGSQQQFWVRIEYQTDEPVRLWARPYREGVQIKQTMTNASSAYTASGQALAWFALLEPGDVDEVRIVAGGEHPYREWEVARRHVTLRWTDQRMAEGVRPQWVTDLLQAEQTRQREDAQRRASTPASVAEVGLFSGFMLFILALLLAGLDVPIWAALKWRGGWRIAAAIPAAVMLFIVLRIVFDTARDPTSHNLWPFAILQFGTGALLVIGVLRWARRRWGPQS